MFNKANDNSAPDPLVSYGKEIVETVRQIDKGAIIWDTKKQGRPDLVEMSYHYYVEFGAEVGRPATYCDHYANANLGRVHHQQPKDDSQHRVRHGEQRCSGLWPCVGLLNVVLLLDDAQGIIFAAHVWR